MRSFRKLIAALLLLLPLCAVMILGAMSLRRYLTGPQFLQHVAIIAQQVASAQLGRDFSIGNIELSDRMIVVTNVAMSDGKRFTTPDQSSRVRRLEVDYDLKSILFEKSLSVPYIPEIRVFDPIAKVTRDKNGALSFMDLIKPSKDKKEPGRVPIGRIVVRNGTLSYRDEGLPHHPDRSATPTQIDLAQADALVHLNSDESVDWRLSANCTSGQIRSIETNGSFETRENQLVVYGTVVDVNVRSLSLPYLPKEIDILAGKASGEFCMNLRLKDKNPMPDLQADLQVAGVSAKLPGVKPIVQNVTGNVRLNNERISAVVEATVEGASVRWDGSVSDLGNLNSVQNGFLAGTATARSLDLKRLATAFGFADELKPFSGLKASVTEIRAELRGRLKTLEVTSRIPIVLSGEVVPDITLTRPSALTLGIQGPLSRPSLQLNGTIPELQAKDQRFSNLTVNGAGGIKSIALDLRADVGDGTVNGRANLEIGKERVRYRVMARARKIDLHKLPLELSEPIGGTANLDVTATGVADFERVRKGEFVKLLPIVEAELQVSAPMYSRFKMRSLRTRLRTLGDEVVIEPLLLKGDEGVVIVSGKVNLAEKTLDLSSDIDQVNLSYLPRFFPDVPSDVTGFGYLREGRIYGRWDDPTLSASIWGFSIGKGDVRSDYANIKVFGNKHALEIDTGRVWRLPARFDISGLIRNPFSPHPILNLEGSFDQLDIQELTRLTGMKDLDASGTIEGQVSVQGAAMRPQISLGPIQVTKASVFDLKLDTLSGTVAYLPDVRGGVWQLQNLLVEAREGSIVADAEFDRNKRFEVTAKGANLDLALANVELNSRLTPSQSGSSPKLSSDTTDIKTVVNLQGKGDFQFKLNGQLNDVPAAAPVPNPSGPVESFLKTRFKELGGVVTASTTGLTVNGVQFGELSSRFGLRGDEIFGISTAENPQALRIGKGESGIFINGFAFNQSQSTLTLDGKLRGLEIASVKQAFINSALFLGKNGESSLEALKGVFTGTLEANFNVSGSLSKPVGHLDWQGKNIVIANQKVQELGGSVDADTAQVKLGTTRLVTDGAVLKAEGQLVYDKRIAGEMTLTGFDLKMLRNWAPDAPLLKTLSGTVTEFSVKASGKPQDSELVATVQAQNVSVAPDGENPLIIESIGVREVRIADKKLFVDRFAVKLPKPAAPATTVTVSTPSKTKLPPSLVPAKGAPGVPGVTTPIAKVPTEGEADNYMAELSGNVDFLWSNGFTVDNPFIKDDAGLYFTARIPRQSFGIIRSLAPNLALDAEGEFSADLEYQGTWLTLRFPGRAEEEGISPDIKGKLRVNAKRLHYGQMATRISDLDARITLSGDRFSIDRNEQTGKEFSAYLEVINPINKAVLRRSEPIFLTGQVALTKDALDKDFRPLHLTSKQMVIFEAPLPIFNSGRALVEIAHPDFGKGNNATVKPGLDLTMNGTLFDPIFSGEIYIRNSEFRPPDIVEEANKKAEAPKFRPKFDLALHVGEKVQINNAFLSAVARTAPKKPITLTGDLASPQLNGNLLISEGILSFPTARFVIRPGGSVTISYPSSASIFSEPSLDLSVNLTADTRLSATSAVTRERKRYNITVFALGSLTAQQSPQLGVQGDSGILGGRGLRLDFQSSPGDLATSTAGLKTRITSLIGGQDALEQLFGRSSNVVSGITEQLATIVSNTLLPNLFDRVGLGKALGFEDLTIDYNQLEQFSFRISRQIVGPLSASYWRRLSSASAGQSLSRQAWELRMSYRLRPNLSIAYTTGDRQTNAFLLEGVFRF